MGAQTGAVAGARTAVEADEPGVEAAAGPKRCTWQAEEVPACTGAARDCRPWVEPPEPAAAGTTAGVGAVGSCVAAAGHAAGHTAAAAVASGEVACLLTRRLPLPPQRPQQPSCGCRLESGP